MLWGRSAPRPRRLGGYGVFWLKALRQPTIDLTIRTHAGLITRIVETPGLSLSEAELGELVSQLRVVAAKTLPEESLTYGIFSGDRERLSRAIVTLICEEATGRPIAFNALSVMEVELDGEPAEVTHLGLVMVDPDERGRGLSWVLYGLTALVLFVRDGLRPKWISNVTQVPSVVGMVSQTFSDVFPSPHPDARQSFAHLQLARGIMSRHRAVFGVGAEAGFDEARFVITNAYTGGSDALKKTFEAAPKHRDEQYNAFCARELDYARGDDVLQLGRIDLAGARRYLLSEVPSGSLPALLATGTALALQRLVLPAVHWMDDTRPFGILRPRTSGKWGRPMTPEMIADSIVNLCGAIGLGVAMVTLYRRDPRSPLTRRLLVALGIIALLFLVRGTAWWSGSGVLDNLSMIPAALIPLGALIVTEGILRRHAPRPAKIVILTGGIVLGLAGAVGSERFAAPFAILLVLVPAWRLCDLRLAAGDARPDHADGVREPQHRAPRRRRHPRHSLHRHRFQGADAGYPGQARGIGGIARRHRDPDRGTRRGDAASGAADDGAAALEFGASRYCRGVCRAGCRCGAGHAI